MTIDPGSERSGSWSEGIFGGEPADVDETASSATWTAPRLDRGCGALVSDFGKARRRGFDDRRGFALEVEEEGGPERRGGVREFVISQIMHSQFLEIRRISFWRI
jgi:hypothetical protein